VESASNSVPLLSAGVTEQMRRWFGSDAKLKGKQSSGHNDLVKAVMETGTGNNTALAEKIHQRYDRYVVL
jgi:hypothetical protein